MEIEVAQKGIGTGSGEKPNARQAWAKDVCRHTMADVTPWIAGTNWIHPRIHDVLGKRLDGGYNCKSGNKTWNSTIKWSGVL